MFVRLYGRLELDCIMTADELKRRFDKISVWRRAGQRAPHKPLLVLYALGRMLRGEPRMVSFRRAEKELKTLLCQNFPDSLHDDILLAVGVDLPADDQTRRIRDPQFRKRVLRAYEYRCAVCGFSVRLGERIVALDASHIGTVMKIGESKKLGTCPYSLGNIGAVC